MPKRRGGNNSTGNGHKYNKVHQQVLNPPFDPRMHAIGNPILNPHLIKRGWIEYAPAEVQGSGRNYRVNFLFNPAAVTTGGGYSLDVPQGNAQSPVLKGTGVAPFLASSGQSVSFQLLYDRTYEMAGYSRDKTWARYIGTYADVSAWYAYLGAFGNNTHLGEQINNVLHSTPRHASDLDVKIWRQLYPQWPIMPKASYLFIGDKLRFYGWVTSFSVNYSHWNHRMVPQRCSIDIGFDILVDPVTLRAARGDPKAISEANGPMSSITPLSHAHLH
jgi:hypothetical protein